MFSFLSRFIDRRENRVTVSPPYAVQLEAYTLHQSLFVVDLHSDALLWSRDLLKRQKRGHVDLPRLVSGNVGLQGFGVVTSSPIGQNYYKTHRRRGDEITLLALMQGWPRRTWRSLMERALLQARKLDEFAARSDGALTVVRSVRDIESLQERRARREQVVGGFLALEGVHALEDRLENLDRLYDAGFRVIGLTHFFDNQAGGSAHGRRKGGLTDFGRAVVQRAQERHLLIDLAHASPQLTSDVLDLASAPVIVSHAGVKGSFDSPRNLSDEHLRRVAAGGGVIGITMFKGALAQPRLDLVVQAMRYVADRVGIEAVALGSDFDGLVRTPVDASGLALLTEALLADGFSAADIRRIMGENALRVLKAVFPEG